MMLYLGPVTAKVIIFRLVDKMNQKNTKKYFINASQYGIDIDWANDATLSDIDFAVPRIQKLLSNINPNKACSPDKIHKEY